MNMLRTLATVALALGLAAGGPSDGVAHEGHNHGAEETPTAGMEDVAARASTVGTHFQLVALPKNGRLVIFLDHTESNIPAQGASIEILAGDALVAAEETAPGLYVVSPWPAEGLTPAEAEGVELVATVVGAGQEEVLLARMSGSSAALHDSHDHDAEPAATKAGRVALWDHALPAAAGLVAVFGVVTGLRSTGRRRWQRFALSGAGTIALIAATSLV